MKTKYMNTHPSPQQYNSVAFSKRRSAGLQSFVASLLLLASSGLSAADVEKEFSLTTEVTRLSNPNLVEDNKQPVTVFRVAPEFNLTVASELNRFYLKSLLSIYRNSNEDVLPNRENPTITAGWERTLASGVFGLEAYYNEDVALIQQLANVGDGTTNTVDNQIKTKAISAKWDHEFNSKFSMKNKASYSDFTFSENTLTLVDYTLSEVASRVIYANAERLSTYAQVGFMELNPDGSIDTSRMSRFRLGAIMSPLDGMDVDANAGFYKTSGLDSSDGMEAEVIGTYTRDRMVYNFGINRLLSPSGIGQFQKSNGLVVGAKYLISEVQTVGAEYSNTFNRAPSNPIAGISQDIRTQYVSAFYEHNFQDWIVRANAKFLSLDNGVTRHGSEIGVALIYGPLRF